MSPQRKEDEENRKRIQCHKRNVKRLGGRGLSLQAFAKAKSRGDGYNPALIKKQREFYKNAKHVSKFKKLVKQQQNAMSSTIRSQQDENEPRDGNEIIKKNKQMKKSSSFSLEDLYKKQCEEKEKARMEREAIIQAKKEEMEKAEARRKFMRAKMFKKTQHGQPVMKYRIENLLHTIQSSAGSSIG